MELTSQMMMYVFFPSIILAIVGISFLIAKDSELFGAIAAIFTLVATISGILWIFQADEENLERQIARSCIVLNRGSEITYNGVVYYVNEDNLHTCKEQ